MNIAERGLRKAVSLMYIFSGAAIVVMMLLTTVDVALRLFVTFQARYDWTFLTFLKPIPGVYELVCFLGVGGGRICHGPYFSGIRPRFGQYPDAQVFFKNPVDNQDCDGLTQLRSFCRHFLAIRDVCKKHQGMGRSIHDAATAVLPVRLRCGFFRRRRLPRADPEDWSMKW